MDTNTYTAGYMSQQLQLSPQDIESELDQAGYKPAFCINDLRHWPVDALVYLRSALRRQGLGNAQQ